MNKPCQKGKIRNPKTGRCVNINSPRLNIVPKISPPPSKPTPTKPKPGKLVKIIQKCGPGQYVNPKTKRCVLLKNKVIQELLNKGYVLEDKMSPPTQPIVQPEPFIVKPVVSPKINPKTPTILVPPKEKPVELIFCGPNKIINPQTGRCIKIDSTIGKKLTSVPYIIINPPKPAPGKPKLGKPKKIDPNNPIIALDKDDDNYVSIKEYLDRVESKGKLEKSQGPNFAYYNQRDLGIAFILTLIKNQKGPIHKIGCIPRFFLCIYKSKKGVNAQYYSLPNEIIKKNLYCPKADPNYGPLGKNNEYYDGSTTNTYASIVIFNTPKYNNTEGEDGKMQILFPPNLRSLIDRCKNDGKYMVVCDLSLIFGTDPRQSSHANVLIFDMNRRVIERFDPHGGSEYSDVKLVYDDKSKIYGRKDFKFGNNFGIVDLPSKILQKKIKSNALANQDYIDQQLAAKFKTILPEFQYYGTNETTPYLGPQVKADAYGGLCVTWSCMYMILRLLNPNLSPAEVTIKMIDGTPEQLLKKILRFQKFIIKTLQNEKSIIKFGNY
tara:strand:+ start:466 stop:2112 length:1647 start_codon:yes stop_codon:yes gene_type:complete